jgi:hypothetical protein
VVKIFFTFLLVCLAWVFFRASSIADAFLIFSKFAALPSELLGYAKYISSLGAVTIIRDSFQLGSEVANPIEGFGLWATLASFVLIAILTVADFLSRKEDGTARLARVPLVPRWAVYCILLLVIYFSAAPSSEFIYFEF